MLRLDGELLPAEEAALKAFLEAHPGLAGEVAAYEAAVLEPETAVVFDEKGRLYKPVARHFHFRVVLWAAAAVLLLALGLQLVPEKAPPAVVKTVTKVQKNVASKSILPVEKASVVQPPAAEKATPETGTVAAENTRSPKKQMFLKPAETRIDVIVPAAIQPFTAQSDRVLALENTLPAEADFLLVEVPETAAVAAAEKESRFAVNLPLLATLKEAAKAGFPKIQSAREKLQGTETTVMLFDRKLFTISF